MLGITAALAAYQGGNPWLEDLMIYLQENRDHLKQTLDTRNARDPHGFA